MEKDLNNEILQKNYSADEVITYLSVKIGVINPWFWSLWINQVKFADSQQN